jgi:hypothetical protein
VHHYFHRDEEEPRSKTFRTKFLHWKAVGKQPWLLRQFCRTDECRVKFKSWGGLRHSRESYLVALITSLPYLRYEKPTMLSVSQQTTSKQKEKTRHWYFKKILSQTWRSLVHAQKQCHSFRYNSYWDGFMVNIRGICMPFFGAPTGTRTARSHHT